jgi:DNA-binding transcriptional ArsR family regulator
VRRLGPALRDALSRGAAPSEVRGSRSGHSAMGSCEARILSYVSHRPCSIKSQIAMAMEISPASVDWHVRRLCKNELLAPRELGGRMCYACVGMLKDEELPLFRVLASGQHRELLAMLLTKGGQSQEELLGFSGEPRASLRRWLKELQGVGTLYSVKDGRTVRYYCSDVLASGADGYMERRKAFLDGTLARFEAQGLRPKILKSDPSEVHILVGVPGRQEPLRLGLNPYVTALWIDKQL